MTRDEAIEIGKRRGTDEADSRGETDDGDPLNPMKRTLRIRRAMAYAAWEFDGKPSGKAADYRREFGLGG